MALDGLLNALTSFGSKREKQRLATQRYRTTKRERYLKASREQRMRYTFRTKYHITEVEYKKLLVENKACQICGVSFTETPHLDHDHKTNKIRGLLCKRCNLALGGFRDDPALLQKAYNYLIGGNVG